MKMKIDGYDALDSACKKRWCWSPGNYQHRGACGSGGSRNTGTTTRCCLERAYRGCPDPVPEPGALAPWDEVTPNDLRDNRLVTDKEIIMDEEFADKLAEKEAEATPLVVMDGHTTLQPLR